MRQSDLPKVQQDVSSRDGPGFLTLEFVWELE